MAGVVNGLHSPYDFEEDLEHSPSLLQSYMLVAAAEGFKRTIVKIDLLKYSTAKVCCKVLSQWQGSRRLKVCISVGNYNYEVKTHYTAEIPYFRSKKKIED